MAHFCGHDVTVVCLPRAERLDERLTVLRSWKTKAMLVAGVAGATVLLSPLASQAQPVRAATTAGTVSYPVSFTVTNVDQATLVRAAPGDGKTYTVNGHITAPAGSLNASNPAATLYMAGHGYGEYFWRFTSVPGYNYAQAAAQAGLISVTVDKLGYGASGIPNGMNAGYGTEATVDHQILNDLRSGSYTMNGGPGVRFSRLALAGGTQSAFSAELEATTFKDVQGVIDAGFADEGFSPGLFANFGINVLTCGTNPQPQIGHTTPSGYAFREPTPAQFVKDDLVDTAPAVQQAAVALQSKDPCGYPAFSVLPTVGQINLFTPTITAPILSVFGADDSEFIVPAATAFQNLEFALNPDHQVTTIPATGQDLTLGNTHATVDATFTKWLCDRNFGAFTNGSCTATPATATHNPSGTNGRTTNGGTGNVATAGLVSSNAARMPSKGQLSTGSSGTASRLRNLRALIGAPCPEPLRGRSP